MEEEQKSVWFNALDWSMGEYLERADPVPTRIKELDNCLVKGMRPGLYTILGKPGEGKSALALAIATNCARFGIRSAILSLEMPASSAWLRCASVWSVDAPDEGDFGCPTFAWSGVDDEAAATIMYGGGNLSTGGDPVITAARVMAAQKLPLMIAEPPDPDINTVLDLLVEAKEAGAQLAVIDYLQLINVPGAERGYDRVTEATNALANAAKGLRLPIILIAALNRDAMTAGAPGMHGAAGSSMVEYASTCVMVYTRDKEAKDEEPGTRKMLLSIEKNRHGPVTDSPIRLTYWPSFNLIQEMERYVGKTS